jgi:very-short-patch-repair endonuclease
MNQFDPPYESPIERDFAWSISKHLSESVELKKQHRIDTRFGRFYVDLAVLSSTVRVAFECDGKEYHLDHLRDECRDALILSIGGITALYRFEGADIHYHCDDCLFYIMKNDPWMFSQRGRGNIGRLATDEARSAVGLSVDGAAEAIENDRYCGYELGRAQVVARTEDGNATPPSWLERRTLANDLGTMRAFISFAKAQQGACGFDELFTNFKCA